MLEDGNSASILDDQAVTAIAVRQHSGFEPYATAPVDRAHLSKSDLLARLSHEMRTPLSAILGFAQLMESGTPSPTVAQQRRIDRILQAGWHLEKLINMAHDLALIESGTLSLSLDTVPLAAVMLDVQAMIESKAQMHGVRVSFPPFETPCFVSADRNRLQQVLANLLSAAIDYSELQGAVVLGCESRSAAWIRVSIDGGKGLSAGQAVPLARPFDAVEQEAPAAEGAGIGLQLAQRLVELMGGTVGAQNTVGTGKVFSFDLKRICMPMAAGRNAIDLSGQKAFLSAGCAPQSMIHSPGNHAHQTK